MTRHDDWPDVPREVLKPRKRKQPVGDPQVEFIKLLSMLAAEDLAKRWHILNDEQSGEENATTVDEIHRKMDLIEAINRYKFGIAGWDQALKTADEYFDNLVKESKTNVQT